MTSPIRGRKRRGRALVLGAGSWQLDLIDRAKRRDLWVLAADISPDAAGREIADEFRQVDTNDRDALVEIAREAASHSS